MRRGIWLLVLGVLGAGLGVASARASGAGTTTTTGTTPTTTPAATTSTAATPSYAPLAVSSLPAGCVGAGAAAVVPLSGSVVALGTPASNLGPSGYPSSAPVVAFGFSSVSGSTCTSERVTLGSVSLFQGAVTASSVAATNGRGAVAGLEIDGTAVSASAGQTLPVEDWGQLTLGGTFGRLTAPLVLRLVQAHGSLSAGTRIAVAFSATGQTVTKPTKKHQPASRTHAGPKGASTRQTHGLQPQKPPPDFPYPTGSAFTKAAQENPVVSIAMQYLGVPYQWGGASPSAGFDCSGLVQYVFAQLGVSLEHYAAAQYHSADTVWVSPKRLQPGDLVFFIGADGTRAAPGHVGIYVDDGYFIDAPHSGTSVRVERLAANRYASGYVGARRVVGRLLAARHRMHEPRVSAPELILGVPSQFTFEPVSESLGGTTGTAALRPGAGASLWLGAPLGAVLILLSTLVVGVRRRRHTADAVPDSETPT
jgi:cell wall-associated NlpC family hydrolase